MKVLLVGATGHLGHNVLQRLVAEQCQVVCAVRHKGNILLPPSDLWIEVEADPTRPVQLASLAKGCDAVVNCAGMTDMAALHAADYKPANIDICRAIAEAVKRFRVPTVVHVSTTNTIGNGTSQAPSTEEMPMAEPFASSLYAQSKAEGERVIGSMAEQCPWCRVVVLNPGYMLGAYDAKPSSGKLLSIAYRRPIAFAPKGGKAFVATADVAAAVWGALCNPQAAGHYLVCSPQGEMSFADLYRLQAKACGYRQVVVSLPNALLALCGRLGDMLRSHDRRTALSTANVRQLMTTEHYDSRRAQRDLGFIPTPIEEAILQYHHWQSAHR